MRTLCGPLRAYSCSAISKPTNCDEFFCSVMDEGEADGCEGSVIARRPINAGSVHPPMQFYQREAILISW